MNLKFHKTLTAEKWASFALHQRLLMIANEMNRAAHWLTTNDIAEARQCYGRAIELSCLTLHSPMRRNLMREFCRMKEMLGRLFVNPSLQSNVLLQNTLIALDPQAFRALRRP